jgi:hypothetical protein
VKAPSDGKWARLQLPFVMGATSNGLAVVSLTASTGAALAVTGDVEFDDARLEELTLGLGQGVCTEAKCTVAFDAFVSNTGVVSGENIDFINGNCTASSGSTTCTYVSTLALSTPMVCISNTDQYHVALGDAATGTTTSVAFFTSNTSHVGTNASLRIHCRKTGADYFAALRANAFGFHSTACGATCAEVLVAKTNISGTVIAGSENYDFINGNPVITDTSLLTFTFNVGHFTVAPVCTFSVESNGVASDHIAKHSVAVTATTLTIRTGASSDTVAYAKSVLPLDIVCVKTGVDALNARTITGTFREVSTVPGVSKPVEYRLMAGGATDSTACTASPCTLHENTNSWAASLTRSSAGVYILTSNAVFKPNSYVYCSRDGSQTSGEATPPYKTNSSGVLIINSFAARNGGAVLTDNVIALNCHGTGI